MHLRKQTSAHAHYVIYQEPGRARGGGHGVVHWLHSHTPR